MFRVFGNAIHRANFDALGLFIPAYTFGASFPIDNKNIVPFRDSFIGALGLTDTTVDAIFGY
jgi:hypothetical protein